MGCHEEEVLRGDTEEWGRWGMGRIRGREEEAGREMGGKEEA